MFENRPALYFCNNIFITANIIFIFWFHIKDTVKKLCIKAEDEIYWRISIIAMALSTLRELFQLTEDDAIRKFHDIILSSKLFYLCYWIALSIMILIRKYCSIMSINLTYFFCLSSFFCCVKFLALSIMILILKILFHVYKIINTYKVAIQHTRIIFFIFLIITRIECWPVFKQDPLI